MGKRINRVIGGVLIATGFVMVFRGTPVTAAYDAGLFLMVVGATRL